MAKLHPRSETTAYWWRDTPPSGAGRGIQSSRVDLTAAQALALRGPLSARGIGGDHVVGDPGLPADGIVVADAFGIPRQIAYCATLDREGRMFKFRDHCAAVGVPFSLGRRQQAGRAAVAGRKRELLDVLAGLRSS